MGDWLCGPGSIGRPAAASFLLCDFGRRRGGRRIQCRLDICQPNNRPVPLFAYSYLYNREREIAPENLLPCRIFQHCQRCGWMSDAGDSKRRAWTDRKLGLGLGRVGAGVVFEH